MKFSTREMVTRFLYKKRFSKIRWHCVSKILTSSFGISFTINLKHRPFRVEFMFIEALTVKNMIIRHMHSKTVKNPFKPGSKLVQKPFKASQKPDRNGAVFNSRTLTNHAYKAPP